MLRVRVRFGMHNVYKLAHPHHGSARRHKIFLYRGGKPMENICVCATTIHAPCTANNSFEYPRYWTIGHHFHRFSNDHPPFFPSTPRRVHQRPTKEKIIEERNAAVEQIFRDPNAFSLSLSPWIFHVFTMANLYVRDVEMIFIEEERIRALFDFCVSLYRRWWIIERCS